MCLPLPGQLQGKPRLSGTASSGQQQHLRLVLAITPLPELVQFRSADEFHDPPVSTQQCRRTRLAEPHRRCRVRGHAIKTLPR